jgi:hypothetical protein
LKDLSHIEPPIFIDNPNNSKLHTIYMVLDYSSLKVTNNYNEEKNIFLPMSLCQNLTFMIRTNMTNDHFLVI